MHIADVESGNLGATGIVGANIPVATGAALACTMKGTDSVVLCFFGDGAANTGSFHESLNMAGVWHLPVVYICENNLYGMSVSVERACAVRDIASRATAYNMPGVVVDGMQVLEVKRVVSQAVERARRGEGPTLIEAKTYRYRGHSRSDPRHYRTREEEEYWRQRDPILLFSRQLVSEGAMTEEEVTALQRAAEEELTEAERFALEQSPFPDPSELHQDVYVGYVQGPRGLERT